jgi:hypothetical protein
LKSLPVTRGAQQVSAPQAMKHRPPNALVVGRHLFELKGGVLSTRRRSKRWACPTTNQRNGNDSPRFRRTNSRRPFLCPLHVDSRHRLDVSITQIAAFSRTMTPIFPSGESHFRSLGAVRQRCGGTPRGARKANTFDRPFPQVRPKVSLGLNEVAERLGVRSIITPGDGLFYFQEKC